MPDSAKDMLRVNVNVEITAAALQAVVANAKRLAPKDANGTYHIDTAEKVSEMISRFLAERDFEQYARDIANYKPASI